MTARKKLTSIISVSFCFLSSYSLFASIDLVFIFDLFGRLFIFTSFSLTKRVDLIIGNVFVRSSLPSLFTFRHLDI